MVTEPVIKQDETSNNVNFGANNAQPNTGQAPDNQATQAGQQVVQGQTGQPAQAQTQAPNSSNTMGDYAKRVVTRNGNYVVDGEKIYNRRNGKLFHVIGGDQGEVEVHPDEAAKIEFGAGSQYSDGNQDSQAAFSSTTTAANIPRKVDTSEIITEEKQQSATNAVLAGLVPGGFEAIRNRKQLVSPDPKVQGAALLKVGGAAFVPYTFSSLRDEINKGGTKPEVLVIGDNDPAPPIERMTKSQVAQEAMTFGLGAAGLAFSTGQSSPAFSLGTKGYEAMRTMFPYTVRPYVREGQVRQLESDLDQFHEGIRKANEVKYD